MKTRNAVIVGGLLAGIVTTAVMSGGRKAGILSKALDRDAVDWIDDQTGSREKIGDTGTSVVEFANHLGASVSFAALYPPLRQALPGVPSVVLGTLMGTAMYVVNIAGIAPILGITKGEVEAGPRKAAERWSVHVIQSVVAAMVIDSASPKN
ncbi:hypothetical protein [uncultured Sphingomonas sp.]|uniref:hypothetical protein n=1 Tax=uncultured Sphingomonas sp. TaxID=158754 RepID=UPI0025D3F5D7|nr:hypothetical protein [uncultured Sphingomonas sp.]